MRFVKSGYVKGLFLSSLLYHVVEGHFTRERQQYSKKLECELGRIELEPADGRMNSFLLLCSWGEGDTRLMVAKVFSCFCERKSRDSKMKRNIMTTCNLWSAHHHCMQKIGHRDLFGGDGILMMKRIILYSMGRG